MEDIIIKSKFQKKIIFLISSLIFVIIGYFSIGIAIGEQGLKNGLNLKGGVIFCVGVLCILFFGYSAFYFAKSLKDNIALKITDEGIYENTSSIKWGLIKWEDVEEIKLRKYLFNTYIEIRVRNVEDYTKRLSPISKFFQKGNDKLGFEIAISTNILDYDTNMLLIQLQNYFDYTKQKQKI